MDGRRQFMAAEEKATVSAERHDRHVGARQLGANGCRQRESEAAKANRVVEGTRPAADERAGAPARDAVDVVEHQRFVRQDTTQSFQRADRVGRALADGGTPPLTNRDDIQPRTPGAEISARETGPRAPLPPVSRPRRSRC